MILEVEDYGFNRTLVALLRLYVNLFSSLYLAEAIDLSLLIEPDPELVLLRLCFKQVGRLAHPLELELVVEAVKAVLGEHENRRVNDLVVQATIACQPEGVEEIVFGFDLLLHLGDVDVRVFQDKVDLAVKQAKVLEEVLLLVKGTRFATALPVRNAVSALDRIFDALCSLRKNVDYTAYWFDNEASSALAKALEETFDSVVLSAFNGFGENSANS